MANQKNSLTAFSEALVEAIAKAGQSTVLVNARRRLPGSGIVYTADLVLTADHVVERDENISIVLGDGSLASATIAGRDQGNDLVLLRLENASSSPAVKADKEAQLGQVVVALGRPNQEGIEASLGIISAIGGPARTGRGGLLERYIRTDAVPFPGFSGGPLIDTDGKVVGLNTSGLAHGTAITIPAPLVWANAENLAKHGYIKRGYLGIRSQQVEIPTDSRKSLDSEQVTGLLLVSVESGSPAEASGLLVGDILVAMNGNPVSDHDELMMILNDAPVGKETKLQILRGGQPKEISVNVGERK